MFDSLSRDEREPFEHFVSVAREFCAFVEACPTRDLRALSQNLPVQLARLCEAGARLPAVSPDSADTVEGVRLDEEKISSLRAALRQKFGASDSYWEVFDPTTTEEPVQGSLSADIVEVYADLRDSLQLLGSSASENDVRWQWRFDFREHWSRHALSALKLTLRLSD